MRLATNQANGNSTGVRTADSHSLSNEHLRTVYFSGTWNGATAQVEASLDDSTYHTVTDVSATANAVKNIQGRFPYLRVAVSGGGGSESITVDVY